MAENKESSPLKSIKPKTNKKPNGDKGPKKPFNFYWIYAIIGVVLISLNLFNWNGNMTDINLSEFEEMVKNEEVDRVVVYNKLTAEVFLKKEALKEEKHAKRIKTPLISGAQNNGSPL